MPYNEDNEKCQECTVKEICKNLTTSSGEHSEIAYLLEQTEQARMKVTSHPMIKSLNQVGQVYFESLLKMAEDLQEDKGDLFEDRHLELLEFVKGSDDLKLALIDMMTIAYIIGFGTSESSLMESVKFFDPGKTMGATN